MCDGQGTEPMLEITCSEQSPENPFCVKNECAPEPDEEDETCKKASGISCTFEGYMPGNIFSLL